MRNALFKTTPCQQLSPKLLVNRRGEELDVRDNGMLDFVGCDPAVVGAAGRSGEGSLLDEDEHLDVADEDLAERLGQACCERVEEAVLERWAVESAKRSPFAMQAVKGTDGRVGEGAEDGERHLGLVLGDGRERGSEQECERVAVLGLDCALCDRDELRERQGCGHRPVGGGGG